MARLALSILLLLGMAVSVSAQDALPETPPELRDFRLDPERATPRSEPQPEVQPPPVAATVEPSPQPNATPPRRAERPTPQRQEALDAPETSEPEATASQQTVAGPTPPVLPPAELKADDIVVPETAQPAPAEQAFRWWQIAVAVIAALALLLGGWLLMRRRTFTAARKPSRSAKATDRDKALVATPALIPVPAPPVPVEKDAPRPRLALEFVPDRATLGFTALTLKGRLQLVNEGDAPARDMQLRVAMISANQKQTATIAAFRDGAIPIEPNSLGDVREGERLALDIEMASQVAELDSYNVGAKRIFVPVMLANVVYDWDGGSDNVTLACMVGRETEPPQPKMGPLRLDLGPRTFAPLGQRPIYA